MKYIDIYTFWFRNKFVVYFEEIDSITTVKVLFKIHRQLLELKLLQHSLSCCLFLYSLLLHKLLQRGLALISRGNFEKPSKYLRDVYASRNVFLT